jgi:very-short-patch-repair endonuclease
MTMATKIPRAKSKAEETLALHLRADDLPKPVREYRFDDTGRLWRFDFAWPAYLFAVEVEGITGGDGGRHQRVVGFQKDVEKYEAAMLQGWTVYRVDQTRVAQGHAVKVIATMLGKLE